MKVTKSQLKQIIKEELSDLKSTDQQTLNESMQQTFPGLLKVLQAITNDEEGLRDSIVKAFQEESLAWLEHGLTRTMKIYDKQGAGPEIAKGYVELLASIRKARQQLAGG
tara:strand:+ start:193 stop:522 length:330 start_codon:yes stop_codon:yes gene_type:complete